MSESTRPTGGRGAAHPTPTIKMLNKCSLEGLTWAQTAQRLKTSYQIVRRASIKHDIAFEKGVRGRPAVKEERLRLLIQPFMDNALDALNLEAIAKVCGCSRSMVYAVLYKMKGKA